MQQNFANTCDISKWISILLQSSGAYGVWNISIGFPSAASDILELSGKITCCRFTDMVAGKTRKRW